MTKAEERFHDAWAETIAAETVAVEAAFEACTAPENRLILARAGDLAGRRVLDLGCGAGEAAVYFAKRGALVTAADSSLGMLEATRRVAGRHGVAVETVRADCGGRLPFPDESFDLVYAANLLHHVDVGRTAAEASRILKPGGLFASWDPVAYNPLINVYRRIARAVRTPDEHPLTLADLRTVARRFPTLEVRTT